MIFFTALPTSAPVTTIESVIVPKSRLAYRAWYTDRVTSATTMARTIRIPAAHRNRACLPRPTPKMMSEMTPRMARR